MEHPTRLDLTLNKPVYRSGETAKLHVKAPFPGTLLLTIEREKVLSYRTVVMKGKYSDFVRAGAVELRAKRLPFGNTGACYFLRIPYQPTTINRCQRGLMA